MSSSYYRVQLEDYLKTLDINAKLLYDVGGKQNPLNRRTKSWKVENHVILDLPDYNLDLVQSVREEGDMVFCLEVFEYLLVPTVAMQNIANLLKPGGLGVITFQFVYPLHNEVEFDSLRYTESGVKRLAEFSGLKIKKIIKRKTKTGSLVKYYNEDGMRGVKGYDHNVTGFIVEVTK
jgi:hypothetical protein